MPKQVRVKIPDPVTQTGINAVKSNLANYAKNSKGGSRKIGIAVGSKTNLSGLKQGRGLKGSVTLPDSNDLKALKNANKTIKKLSKYDMKKKRAVSDTVTRSVAATGANASTGVVGGVAVSNQNKGRDDSKLESIKQVVKDALEQNINSGENTTSDDPEKTGGVDYADVRGKYRRED